MGGRLLIASNRLPVTLSSEGEQPCLVSSTGGLATALKGPHARMEGCWFGWPGDLSKVSQDRRPSVAAALESLGTVPVELSAKEIAHYYDGFSNGVLWPLLHYLLDKVNLDAERDWQAFRAVNERFARVIAAHHRPGDHVWVHDYHLALLPQLLRERLPGAKVGFFLHVPFPAADVFRILPWREEILRGVLGADLVGFHTTTYARNFREAAQLVTGAAVDGADVLYDDRRIEVGAFPIGVDAAAFARAAESAEVGQRAAEIRAAAGGKQIVLGVDRLDYTKGVPRRLLAIERLLAEQPALRDRIHFVQLAVPTRENVDAYADLRRNVNELVGRINSQHGSATGAPLHLLYRSVDFNELVALYRAADVMLVTPLRDGMNLVAKEFAAARGDGGGVLVLSEFAGAAAELRDALLVNPYDPAGMARALAQALQMTPEERNRRMATLHAAVASHDVDRWSDEYLERLRACAQPICRKSDGPLMTPKKETLPEALVRAKTARARTIVLDYDGTLVGFAATPEQALPADDVRWLLAALAAQPETTVHVVSGRDRDSLQRWLGDLRLGLHAEHGFWSRVHGEWRANGTPPLDWQQPVRALMEDVARRTPGALVEVKASAIAFHHRQVEPAIGAQQVRELRRMLGTLLASEPIEVLAGASVLEVRPRGVHKGVVVERLAAEAAAQGAVILAAGDDLTDEDTFRALPPGSIAIKVGNGPSLAPFQVATPSELRRLLWTLI